VIEYFYKHEDIKIPNDADLHIHSESNENQNLKQFFDDSTQSFKNQKIKIGKNDNRVYTLRWKWIEKIVLIEPCQQQIYFSESLDHPHYTIHPLEHESFLQYVVTFQNKNHNKPDLVFCSSKENHYIPGFIYITNIFEDEVANAVREFDVEDIIHVIETRGKKDNKRGNVKLDIGLASAQCQLRRREWHGLSGPNVLEATNDRVMTKMRKGLYPLLSVASPHHIKNDVYHDRERKSLFDYDDEMLHPSDMHIHSVRAAITYPFTYLSVHRDTQNDNGDPKFSPVMVVSWLLKVGQRHLRLALITYSRKCVRDSFVKIKKYGPAIKYMEDVYNRLKKEGRVIIDKSLFKQQFTVSGNCNITAARILPHVDTCLHYSSMGADAILNLNRKYKLNYQHGLALLLSVCACNSPDYFRVITNTLLSNDALGNGYFQKSPLNIAIDIYEMIFDFKKEASGRQHTLAGQRHQPCAKEHVMQLLLPLRTWLVFVTSAHRGILKIKVLEGTKMYVSFILHYLQDYATMKTRGEFMAPVL
jgi:hypothetical protein